jgi:cell division protease FtsH
VQTTGAANDIQRATALAKNMVTLYGMSDELGLMAPATVNNAYLDGQSYLDCSQETAAAVDREIKTILEQSFIEAKQMLDSNRQLLDQIAEHLLLKETITGDELMAFVNAENQENPAVNAEESDFAEE